MSWWDTGNGDDVIGDQPADMVRDGLVQLVEENVKRGRPKPSLVDLLQAIVTIAKRSAGTQLADTPAGLEQIIAGLKSGETILSGPLRVDASVSDLTGPLEKSLGEMLTVYLERWKRQPRFSEWLETLMFVLRHRPEDYLRDGAEHSPESFKAA